MIHIYIYSKDNKVEALNEKYALELHEDFIKNGWEHKATLNAVNFIQNICNSTDEEILSNIKSLKNGKST